MRAFWMACLGPWFSNHFIKLANFLIERQSSAISFRKKKTRSQELVIGSSAHSLCPTHRIYLSDASMLDSLPCIWSEGSLTLPRPLYQCAKLARGIGDRSSCCAQSSRERIELGVQKSRWKRARDRQCVRDLWSSDPSNPPKTFRVCLA